MSLTLNQIENRKKGITSTELSVICGKGAFKKTPLDVYYEKIGLKEPEDLSDNLIIKMGHLLEPLVADSYAKTTGKKLLMPPEDHTYVSKNYPYIISHIDRLIDGESGILECKTTGFFDKEKWGEEWTDNMPDAYLLQVVHQCYVLDKEFADLAVMSKATGEVKIYKYIRKEKYDNLIVNICKNFWEEHVEKCIPPKAVNPADVAKLWPHHEEGSYFVATEIMKKLLRDLNDTRNVIKDFQKREEALKSHIAEMFEDKEFLLDKEGGKKIATYKTRITKRIDSDKLKSNYAEIYQDCLKETSSRFLTIR